MSLTPIRYLSPQRKKTEDTNKKTPLSEPRSMKKRNTHSLKKTTSLLNLIKSNTPDSNQGTILSRNILTSEEHNISIERITVLSGNTPVGIGYSSSWRNATQLFHKEAQNNDWAGTYFGDTVSQACSYIDDYSQKSDVSIYQLSLREYSELTLYYCSGLGLSNSEIPGNEKSENIKTLLRFPPDISLMKSLENNNAVYIGPSEEEGSDVEIIVPIQYDSLTLEEKKSYFVRPHSSGLYDLFEKKSPIKYDSRQDSPGEKLKRELSRSLLLDYSLTEHLLSNKENTHLAANGSSLLSIELSI